MQIIVLQTISSDLLIVLLARNDIIIFLSSADIVTFFCTGLSLSAKKTLFAGAMAIYKIKQLVGYN